MGWCKSSNVNDSKVEILGLEDTLKIHVDRISDMEASAASNFLSDTRRNNQSSRYSCLLR
jgi:hypothetical protein